jgi:hypothetical protein
LCGKLSSEMEVFAECEEWGLYKLLKLIKCGGKANRL